MNPIPLNQSTPLIELRRYTAAAGRRGDLARRLDDDLAPAFQQLGGVAIGHFCERDRPDGVAWLRGFGSRDQCARIGRAVDAQAALAGADGDSLLLTALNAATALALPSGGGAARGIVVAHILPVRPGLLDQCARAAETRFAGYHGHGVIEAGILVTPQENRCGPGAVHAGRAAAAAKEREPVLVWLGIVRDEAALAELRPALDSAASALSGAGLLAAPGEVLVLEPCARSRLRWVGAAAVTAPARAFALAAA